MTYQNNSTGRYVGDAPAIVGQLTSNPMCGTFTVTLAGQKLIECPGPLNGQYVLVQVTALIPRSLELNEVTVFGSA